MVRWTQTGQEGLLLPSPHPPLIWQMHCWPFHKNVPGLGVSVLALWSLRGERRWEAGGGSGQRDQQRRIVWRLWRGPCSSLSVTLHVKALGCRSGEPRCPCESSLRHCPNGAGCHSAESPPSRLPECQQPAFGQCLPSHLSQGPPTCHHLQLVENCPRALCCPSQRRSGSRFYWMVRRLSPMQVRVLEERSRCRMRIGGLS